MLKVHCFCAVSLGSIVTTHSYHWIPPCLYHFLCRLLPPVVEKEISRILVSVAGAVNLSIWGKHLIFLTKTSRISSEHCDLSGPRCDAVSDSFPWFRPMLLQLFPPSAAQVYFWLKWKADKEVGELGTVSLILKEVSSACITISKESQSLSSWLQWTRDDGREGGGKSVAAPLEYPYFEAALFGCCMITSCLLCKGITLSSVPNANLIKPCFCLNVH